MLLCAGHGQIGGLSGGHGALGFVWGPGQHVLRRKCHGLDLSPQAQLPTAAEAPGREEADGLHEAVVRTLLIM